MDVLEQVLAYASASGGGPSVTDGSRTRSGPELASEIAATAAGLAARGVAPGDRVAIRLPSSVDGLVVALGCLWLGAIFVPLSPTDPAARLAAILEDCRPALLVTTEEAAGSSALPAGAPRSATAAALREAGEPAARAAAGSAPAYVIYTSGTTGTPKGVLVSRAAFSNSVEDTIAMVGLGPTTRALCISAFHFDGSFHTLFGVPAAGGHLVILRREPMVLPSAVVARILEESVDFTSTSPSFLRLLLESSALGRLQGSALRTIGFGGEPFAARELLALMAALPAVRFVNLYGPTEAVISVTAHEMDRRQLAETGEVAFGSVHPGVRFHLLDEEGREIDEVGAPGELYLGGDQLMDGYWGDPALSARVLRRDLVPGEVVYRTGDIVRRNVRGEYVFLARADRVVKRNGVRISLDEIEAILREVPGVTNAASLLDEQDEATRIEAFVALHDGADGEDAADHLWAALRRRLPSSMVPDEVVVLGVLPLTAAGKVDYRALRRQKLTLR